MFFGWFKFKIVCMKSIFKCIFIISIDMMIRIKCVIILMFQFLLYVLFLIFVENNVVYIVQLFEYFKVCKDSYLVYKVVKLKDIKRDYQSMIFKRDYFDIVKGIMLRYYFLFIYLFGVLEKYW